MIESGKKRRLDNSTTGFTYTLLLEKLDNKQMGKVLRESTKMNEVDNVLTHAAVWEGVAAVKWFQLQATKISLKDWNAQYKQLSEDAREEDDNTARVKELVYYPLLLPFYQAAAGGQEEITFRKQDNTKEAPREDLLGFVYNNSECPVEVKLMLSLGNGGENGGILANMDAFAGLARCLARVASKITF